jgi:group I intron endonuclease
MENIVYQITIGKYKQIGSTKNYQRRMDEHLRALNKNEHPNAFMQSVYNKYKEFSSTILSSHKTREEAYKAEQLLLNEHFGKDDYMMLNNQATGAATGDANVSKRPDVRAKIGLSKSGDKSHSKRPEMREKSRLNMLGEKNPRYGKPKLEIAGRPMKKVQQIDINTKEVLREFKSCHEASRETKIHRGNISTCCRGDLKSAGGFIWKYI